MFKYLWIVALIIAYVVAWVNVARDISYVNRVFRRGYRFKNLEDFSQGWIIMHVAMPIIVSFCLFLEG